MNTKRDEAQILVVAEKKTGGKYEAGQKNQSEAEILEAQCKALEEESATEPCCG